MATKLRRRRAMTRSQKGFALEYLANGFNAAAAYRSVHPKATSGTSRIEASRTLALPYVRAYIEKRIGKAWKKRHMDGDEALALVAMDARADPRWLVDEMGVPLTLSDWPADLASSVESVEFDGATVKRVRFVSKAAARRTILEITGKVKNPVGAVLDALAEAMRADLEKHIKSET
jgi:hypothetical protein